LVTYGGYAANNNLRVNVEDLTAGWTDIPLTVLALRDLANNFVRAAAAILH
jgi:hypothetical protein